MTLRYAALVAQLVTRLSDELLVQADHLVAEGLVGSRSEAVRAGLEALVDRYRRQQIGERIMAGYERLPETEDELAGLDEALRAMVLEEPW